MTEPEQVEEKSLLIEDGRYRIEFNEPGMHPYISMKLSGNEGEWLQAVILGARQFRDFHKGSSFPRLVCAREEENSAGVEVLQTGNGKVGAILTEQRAGFDIASDITVEDGEPIIHVVHRLEAVRDVALNRVFDRYDFVAAPGAGSAGELDYSFVPHLRPKEDMVIGDHVFRSPVVMMSKWGIFFALIPDLEIMSNAYLEGSARYYLDFLVTGGENNSPAVHFGLGRTRHTGHVYFRRDFHHPIEVGSGESLTLGYYLLLDRGGIGREDVLSFLWDRFGKEYLQENSPQMVSFDRYASAALERMFKKADLFRRFELERQPCGGTVAIHLTTRKGVRLMSRRELDRYLQYEDTLLDLRRVGLEQLTRRPAGNRLLEKIIYRYGPRVLPQIMFQSWFNNLRSAYGAYWFGRKWRDHELVERALSVKNLAILAPGEQGAFPAVCYPTEEGLFWSRGTQAFKHVDYYHTADSATTAYYMTLWYRDHEGDPRLLRRCREFAQFLIDVQLPSGAYPAWVRPSDYAPDYLPELRESATTACPAMFLALLYMVDRDERHLESAREAADFLATQVIPRQRWFDYETFFSCSTKKLDMFDSNTGTFPQNTMSMYWAAEAYRLLYLSTGEKGYLDLGLQVLDHLCLYQQVWDPPFLDINAFGGFGVMNTDGEWNDSRQALFVPVLMDYYSLTGRNEHMERAIAALHASFTTMYIEENRPVAGGNVSPFHRRETGSIAENYGHFGYDHRTPGYLQSDWGAGSASFAAAYAQKHYGDVFIDIKRKQAFGINGCRVSSLEVEGKRLRLELDKHIAEGLEATLRVSGGVPDLEVHVNGVPARKVREGEYLTML